MKRKEKLKMSKTIPLRPQSEQFTDSQWQAVFDGDKNILVSASAGSGKTTVLVRRVIEKIKSGVDVDRLLIVTYTEAAAKEMKERIQSALQKAINEESDSAMQRHFAKQLSLLPTANISTLHAFCLTVIRRFYYLIEADPVFRLLTDETETLLLKEDVWDALRETFYAENQAAFYRLTENFSNDRSDDGLTKLIFAFYDFAKANPDPAAWIEQLSSSYEVGERLGDSALFQTYLKPNLLETVQRCLQRYEEMIQLTENEEKLMKICQLAQNEARQTQQFLVQLEANDLEAAYQQATSFVFDRYPTVRKEELKPIANQAKDLREQNKKALNDLKSSLFTLSPTEMKTVLQEAAPIVAEMAQVGKAFIEAYGAEKLRRNLVDFNDLEHYTLEILTKKTATGFIASEASVYYRQKFDEVLVDEYQDINQLQETILYWLRKPKAAEGNLFMVGDVKQSIYSFRLADPTLFIEKYTKYGQGEDGKRIILAENFRSRKTVLDFTNLVFEQLMDERVGQIDYDEAAALIPGFDQFTEAADYATELLIYEKKADTSPEQEHILPELAASEFALEDKTEGELYLTALKIRELIDQKFLIYDKKTQTNRPVTYRDIVLLTPTKKNNLAILEVFKAVGIPIQVNDAQNYFQATEIRIMIALLQLIDNPYQDIPLAAVLRSPMVGLKEKELVLIRLANQKASYYEAFLDFNQKLEPTMEEAAVQEKTLQFAALLEKWREMARRNQLADLLWTIYRDTAYLDYVGGLPAGKQRQANLYALVDRGAAYEKTTFRGLFQFVRFIEKMQEKDKDLAEPVVLTDENAVRVMTIHASKGLEFPLVFILDMTKEFNLSDLNERYIFEEKLGVGLRFLQPEHRVLYDTLPFLAIKQVRMRKLLSEEMRKLYVALTRAEQKLFLVGSYNDEATMWKEWQKVADVNTKVLPVENRLQAKSSLMNWVGMSLIRHQTASAYQQDLTVATLPEIWNHPAAFTIECKNEAEIKASLAQLHFTDEADAIEVSDQAVSANLITKGLTRLNYRYPFEVATRTTSYQSVSEIKRVFDDPDNQQLVQIDVQPNQTIQANPVIVNRMIEGELEKPKFLETVQAPSAAEVGTATHYLLQLMELTEKPTLATLEALRDQLIQRKVINKEVAVRINLNKIVAFYETNFGEMLLKHASSVKREQPFSMLLDAKELFQDYPEQTNDPLLIHGIIDGYIEVADGYILYDYKTDYVSALDPQAINDIVERYQGQLALYQRALQEATNKKVRGMYLILLSAGAVVDVTNSAVVDWFK
jgi:ATP-dependent helicase/nuclease subunit A